ncbi:ArsA-related P-loop ATPase [soil metagenome]
MWRIGYHYPVDVVDLLGRRLLLVTGKGGVGKSTVAAALAVASSRMGRKTCLVEVEGRQTFSNLFATAPWDFDEREFRPDLFGLSIDPEASLTEYLSLFYGAQRITRLVAKTPAVEFATQAAPGIKDVLLIGKVKEMERRRRPDGRFVYDLIVVDAPPTGRIVNFLAAPEATTELVNVGPVREQANTVIDMLTDADRTALLLTTLLEEMPVSETSESVTALQNLGVHLGPILVNRVAMPVMDVQALKVTEDMDAPQVNVVLQDVVGSDLGTVAEELLALGTAHRSRLELQSRMRSRLSEETVLPTGELPYVADAATGEDIVTAVATALEDLIAGG